jgi:phosphopantetheinyl transferase
MPLLVHKHLEPSLEIGIWQIAEEEDWFVERLTLYEEEESQLAQIKGRRRLEWLASRQLVHQMSGRAKRSAFLKDEYGKPYLDGSSYQISLSHSHGMTAAIAGPCELGIDIQKIVPKIGRIAHKFLRAEEQDCIQPHFFRLEHLHVFWGAKESLYKAYGRRSLDFGKHILVDPFPYHPHIGVCRGRVEKEYYHQRFEIRYEMVLADHMLVYAREV